MGRRRRLAGVALAAFLLPAVLAAQDRGGSRSLAAVPGAGSGLLDGIVGGLLPDGSAGAPEMAAFQPASASGYAAQAGGTALSVDVGLALQGARLDVGSATATYRSEPGGPPAGGVAPSVTHGDAGHARGVGVELSALGVVPVLGAVAEATSPPSSGRVTRDAGAFRIAPVLEASALRGEAEARSPSRGCVLGSDLSYGLGRTAAVGVGDLGLGLGLGLVSTRDTDPAVAVLSSSARTALVDSGDGSRLALLSEVRQTLAPMVFLAGTPGQFTIDFGGAWLLQARADGREGTVSYGPVDAAPGAAAVRVFDGSGTVVASVAVEDVGGPRGLVTVPGVAEISVGEPPRPFAGGDRPDPGPGLVSAAVDVARVRLLGGGADIRVGHMEVAVAVPDGGVRCPGLAVSAGGRAEPLPAGGDAAFTLEVANANDGILSGVEADVSLAATPGVEFDVVATDSAARITDEGVSWEGGRPVPPGDIERFEFTIRVAPGSLPGRVTGHLRARGHYGEAATGAAVPVSGDGELILEVLAGAVPSPATPAAVEASAPPPQPTAAPPPRVAAGRPPAAAPSPPAESPTVPPPAPSPPAAEPLAAEPPSAIAPVADDPVTPPSPPESSGPRDDPQDTRDRPVALAPTRDRGADPARTPWATVAGLMALSVAVLTVRHGRRRPAGRRG